MVVMIAMAVLWPAVSPPAFAQSDDNYKVAGDIAAYLGVMPAAIVGEHAAGHPEKEMHGGPPAGKHAHHIVIALFDQPSGRRIENAEVTAYVSGLGHVGGTRLTLEPMLIADVITYGGFVTLPVSDRYTIDIEVKRPDPVMSGDNPVTTTTIDFLYEHNAE